MIIAKRLWNVKYKYNKELDLLYLEAQSGRNSLPQIYIPWSTVNTISLNQMDQIQQQLHSDRLIFVFKEGDSSSVYYRVSAGLVKPMAPEVTKQLKQIEDKRTGLEKEIRKNTSNLYELAKSISTNNIIQESNLDEQEVIEVLPKI